MKKIKMQDLSTKIAGGIIWIPVLIFLVLLSIAVKIDSMFAYFKNDIPENQENDEVISYNKLAAAEDFDHF
jgi:hypothetical protein